uniref:Uncharacterized protein n=1 Tax=Parascaris equorum TaxID=6256 RepID=A0A914S2N3_PAREQ
MGHPLWKVTISLSYERHCKIWKANCTKLSMHSPRRQNRRNSELTLLRTL